MFNAAEGPGTPAMQQYEDPQALRQRQRSSPFCGAQRGPVHIAAVPASVGGLARVADAPLAGCQTFTSPTQNLFLDGFASIAPPLLLSRSIRETTLHRVDSGLSRTASTYATSGDDTDEEHGVGSTTEMPELLLKDGSAAGSLSGRVASTTSNPLPNLPSPASPCSNSEAAAATTNFESLWSNIERYLFTVYATLQTGDESSLRPLRAPRHRMGWYTVIYNACSGDPAKSRELYTRLALLLLHILESHVLFPILQNIDHSRVQFLAGAEDSAAVAEDAGNESLRFNGSGGSFSGRGCFTGAAGGNGGASSSGSQSRGARSKVTSRNSSFHDNVGRGGNRNRSSSSSRQNNVSNSSFGFMRRLFQTSHRVNSPVVARRQTDDANVDHVSMAAMDQQSSSSPGVRSTPISAAAAPAKAVQLTGSQVGWSSTYGPNAPPQIPIRTNNNCASAITTQSTAPVAAASSKLRTAFDGFDSTVYHNRSPTPHSLVSHQSTESTVTYTASGTSTTSQSSTADPRTASPVALQYAVSASRQHQHHHARVASKTGRVLVNDEEEVLCEENTVTFGPQHSKRQPRLRTKKHAEAESSKRVKPTLPPSQWQLQNSADAGTRTRLSDDFDGSGSLHTMTSSLSSPRLSHDVSNREDGSVSALTGGSATTFRRDQRREGGLAGRGNTSGNGARPSHRPAGPSNSPDYETEGLTAVPSANFVSPCTASLVSAEDTDSSFSMNPSSTVYGATTEHNVTVASSVKTAPFSAAASPTTAAMTTTREGTDLLPYVFRNPEATTVLPNGCANDSASGMINPVSTQSTTPKSTQMSMSRQASSSGPGSCHTGKETAVPMSPFTVAHDPMSPQERSLCNSSLRHGSTCIGDDGGHPPCPVKHHIGDTIGAASSHAGSNVYGGCRFSLCYTFIQEWQTFLVFRGVVLSCFRYLDQYYTRRYGMDTITLMCFKVLYVTVYEPLRPLLILELRYLTQCVREGFEATGQIAWEQVELIQSTYNIMAELLVLVQSTSSYMVAQQQQQQKSFSGSVGGGTVTKTKSSAAAAVALAQSTSHASAEPQHSRTSSQNRGLSGRKHGGNSTTTTNIANTASSTASMPRTSSAEVASPSSTSSTTGNNTAKTDKSSMPCATSRQSRLFSLFSGRRHTDKSAPAKDELQPALPSASPSDNAKSGGGRVSVFTICRSSPRCESRSSKTDGGRGGLSHCYSSEGRNVLSAPDELLEVGDVDHVARSSSSSPGASPLGTPGMSTVVVDLRGTVELRDRLEGHTTAHHLTTQALKQWEGLAADRRLRNGTIVKETAKPLATIVMEDMGNDYIAGIYSFYRSASEAHRDTEGGRRYYVEWALGVKELEMHVWRRVRLPFLHTALRSALNEVLVVEQHRNILLDQQFGLRALLDEWAASVKCDDLALAPQMSAFALGGQGAAALHGAGASSAPLLAARSAPNSNPFPTAPLHTGLSLTRAASESGEAPIKVRIQGGEQHFISSFPRPTMLTPPSFHQLSHHGSMPFPLPEALSAKTTTATQNCESNWRWEQARGASRVTNSAATVASAASAALPAPSCGSSGRFVERVGTWVSLGQTSNRESPTTAAVATTDTDGDRVRIFPEEEKPSSDSAHSSASRRVLQNENFSDIQKTPDAVKKRVAAATAAALTADVAATTSPPAMESLQALYGLFSDVTEDECFVLMAAVLITKFIRDSADLFEEYVKMLTMAVEEPGCGNGGAGGNSSRCAVASPSSFPIHSPSVAAATAAAVANAGVHLMTSLVDLIDRYTNLVEIVFRNQPILHRALKDAVEEVMCPTRWTKKGSLHAAQQRAQEMLVAAAAVNPADNETTIPKSDLPSVLLNRDARHATLPLVSLAAQHPQAVQRLKLSVLLARYADAFLQQERVGGRVVSSGIFKRLRLISRLVSLLEDKDTFLEHYRLYLARRLLGTSGSVAGREPQDPLSSTPLNLEAERQLVSCLQSYLGATGAHAFEAMLRDYEGTQRTRDLFEQEPEFAALEAKFRVQLITSAQWPMYTMLPLTPHVSLQRGIDAFRTYYARIHPSRSLLWVFSLGTATLTAQVVSGTKQVVASTLLATLLLVVSDAYNAKAGHAGSISGVEITQRVGMPFHVLRTHLHLLSQHRAFNFLQWTPATKAAVGSAASSAAAITENDTFTLNAVYTHRLRKIRLPLPKTRLTGLPSSEAGVDQAMSPMAEGTERATAAAATAAGMAPPESEDAVVSRRVNASRRLLLDTALVRVFKSRRVVMFDDLFQAVTTQLSRQFVPSRRDVKAQLEGLIDRDYVKRSADDPNTFVYVS